MPTPIVATGMCFSRIGFIEPVPVPLRRSVKLRLFPQSSCGVSNCVLGTAFYSLLWWYFLHPADLTGFEANLDAMRMCWGLRQNISDNPSGEVAATLVLLLDNLHFQASGYLVSFNSTHMFLSEASRCLGAIASALRQFLMGGFHACSGSG